MKTLIKIIVLFISILVAANAASLNEHYLFTYESGDVYDVILTDNTITWAGMKGSDVGLSEIDTIQRKSLSKNTEAIQWVEKNGTFVTVIINKKSLKKLVPVSFYKILGL